AAFDLASGRLLWSHALPYDDPGFFVESENREDRRPYGQIAAGGGLVAVWSRTRRHVELLNSANGASAGGVDLPAEPRWLGLSAAGEVIAVLMRGDHGAIEGRDARSGAQTWRLDLPLTERNPRRFASILSADRTTVYLCADRSLAAVDLAQHKLTWSVPTGGGEDLSLHLDGGLLVVAAHQGDSWRNHALEPAAGKTVFDGEVYKGWRPYLADSFRFVGDRAIGMNDQRGGGHPTVICRSLSGNKELWSADLGDAWHHRCVGFQAAGKYLAVLEHPEDDLRLRYLLLDLETGRPAGSGMLPGTDVAHRESVMPTAFVAGQLVYAAREGMCAVGGLPPPPAGRLALEAALDQVRATAGQPGPAHEGASEFTALYRPDTRPALFTRQALRIDGQLDDWAGDEAIALGDALDVRSAPGGAWGGAPDLSAKARVAWDRRFVYLAIETGDDRHEPPALGGSPLDGDSVVVGIDPQGSNAGEQSPLVLALSLSDGRTRVTQISGAPLPLPDAADEAGKGDEDRVTARAVRKAAGCTYEVAIPWTALRANPGERPGYRLAMGLGVAVVDWDGGKPKAALEWGYGLMRGIAANRMARIQFVDLTPERIAGYRKFIALMPTHEFAWRFVERIAATHIGPAGLPGRVGEIEGYIAANPAGVHTATAIAELERLYRSGGSAEPGEQAARFALKAGVAAR
ncbi:MAG: PQQ-binding-like beta-propeller repeat protein, partial [Planctomycetes bacterium]|nr:PQQ-binding-like beta-propeller repeat protein [Planctomycetota bacterium]